MTKKEQEAIVSGITERLMKVFEPLVTTAAEQLKNDVPAAPTYVGLPEASRILGISISQMRKIKHIFPYIKKGDESRGRIYFEKESLQSIYREKWLQR